MKLPPALGRKIAEVKKPGVELVGWKTRILRQLCMYIQLIQSVWAECRACTLYWNIVCWCDFLPIPTVSAVRYLGTYVFCVISSSSILRAQLYKTPPSMDTYISTAEATKDANISIKKAINVPTKARQW